MNEQDIRIEARDWCGPVDTDHGATENQVENIDLHFFQKGEEQERRKHELEIKEARECMLVHETSKSKCTLCQNKSCPLNEAKKP